MAKVLIIDDDRDIRTGLNVRLRSEGFDTAFAEDAVTAISAARKERPDLILLDIGLPAGDGYVVMERLKDIAELATVPVIVVSCRDPRENKRRSLEAGARAYFQKPVSNDELLFAIGQHLGSHTQN